MKTVGESQMMSRARWASTPPAKEAAEIRIIARAAVDLYGFEVLKSLRLCLPKNPGEEVELWGDLMLWL